MGVVSGERDRVLHGHSQVDEAVFWRVAKQFPDLNIIRQRVYRKWTRPVAQGGSGGPNWWRERLWLALFQAPPTWSRSARLGRCRGCPRCDLLVHSPLPYCIEDQAIDGSRRVARRIIKLSYPQRGERCITFVKVHGRAWRCAEVQRSAYRNFVRS